MVNKYTKYIRNRAPRPELHDKILLATKAMFYKQGIKQVRMDDIAKELTISKRTLYEISTTRKRCCWNVSSTNISRRKATSSARPLECQCAGGGAALLRIHDEGTAAHQPDLLRGHEEVSGVLAYMRSKRDQNFKDVVIVPSKAEYGPLLDLLNRKGRRPMWKTAAGLPLVRSA